MPVISNLGSLGAIDAMLSLNEFTIEDIRQIPNKEVLLTTFRYLARLGLLEENDSKKRVFKITDFGKEIFGRHGSFYVPHSYQPYMHSFEELLKSPSPKLNGEVNRLENSVGSGLTHRRYFFSVLSLLKRRVAFDVLVDIGCGNGNFLREALKEFPKREAIGVDISPICIETAEKNLKKEYPKRDVTLICCDAGDIGTWGKKILQKAAGKKIVLSMWFLVHEISRNNPDFVIKFLKRIHDLFPEVTVVLCELVRLSDRVLSRQRALSIMPEYLFFHDLSGQGILSWEEYERISRKIPYEIFAERTFDELTSEDGKRIPSVFIWLLKPQNNKHKNGK